MTKFFIDTADTNYIRDFCKLLPKEVIENQFLGITTNPAAFQKVGKLSLRDWLQRTRELSDLLVEIAPNNVKELHVQLPNSNINKESASIFITLVNVMTGDQVQPIIKISPSVNFTFSDCIFNMTGIANGDFIKNYFEKSKLKYMSIIPGRMDIAGIKSDNHLFQATKNKNIDVIAGSMRTIEGLQKSIIHGCIPTIGITVLDLLKNDISILNEKESEMKVNLYTDPHDIEKTQMLTRKFFQQMDDAAAICYKDLLAT